MQRYLRIVRILVIALLCFGGMMGVLLSPSVCEASDAVALDVGQLAALSDVIVHGKVVHSEAVVFADGRVMTRHTVQVIRWVKQDYEGAPATIEFYTRGGVVGDMVTRVTGEVQIRGGDEAVLFLADIPANGERHEGKHYFCVGLSQGAYIVISSAEEKRVVRSDERIRRRVARMHLARASFARDVPMVGDVSLDDFLAQVTAEVAAGRDRDEVIRAFPARRIAP